MVKKLILFSVLFLMAFGANAKELFVNNSGSPACSDSTTRANNSASSPWCTLLRAVRGNSDGDRNSAGVTSQAAQAGDTVYVSAGTYDYAGPAYTAGSWLGVFYDPVNNGTFDAWVAFEAIGTVTLTGNLSGNSSMIGSNQAQYIRWVGFTLNQALSSYRNGIATASVDNIWFEGNTIIGEYTDWGYSDNHPGVMIHGPKDTDCTGGISNITIKNNTISGFTGTNGRKDNGITLYCLGDNILIENNDIFNNDTGINAKSNYIDNNNIFVRKNHFYNNSGNAIAMQAFSDWHVYQNIMENNGTGFLFFNTIYYVGNTKPNDVYVVNNTMYNNTVGGIYFKSLCQNLNNNHVANNLIIGSPSIIIVDSSECTTTENMGVDDVSFDWNFYVYSGGFFVNDATTLIANFSTWQSSYGQSPNSFHDTDPLFVNPGGGDFKLQAGSSARDAVEDILDLDDDGSTTDLITAGAYITGNETIGVDTVPASPTVPGSVGVEWQ